MWEWSLLYSPKIHDFFLISGYILLPRQSKKGLNTYKFPFVMAWPSRPRPFKMREVVGTLTKNWTSTRKKTMPFFFFFFLFSFFFFFSFLFLSSWFFVEVRDGRDVELVFDEGGFLLLFWVAQVVVCEVHSAIPLSFSLLFFVFLWNDKHCIPGWWFIAMTTPSPHPCSRFHTLRF